MLVNYFDNIANLIVHCCRYSKLRLVPYRALLVGGLYHALNCIVLLLFVPQRILSFDTDLLFSFFYGIRILQLLYSKKSALLVYIEYLIFCPFCACDVHSGRIDGLVE